MQNSALSQTQEKILKAALLLTSKKGYHQTTTKEIAKLSAVNETTLFRNFKNKEGIFMAAKASEVALIEGKTEAFYKLAFKDTESFVHEAGAFLYSLFTEHYEILSIMIKDLETKGLGMGDNSIFEFSVRSFLTGLSKQIKTPATGFKPEAFTLVSALIFLSIDIKSKDLLTDELGQKIEASSISDLIYASIEKKIKKESF